jgi:hypothetical protein
MIGSVAVAGSTIPSAIVAATSMEMSAPAKLSTAERATASRVVEPVSEVEREGGADDDVEQEVGAHMAGVPGPWAPDRLNSQPAHADVFSRTCQPRPLLVTSPLLARSGITRYR